MKIIGIVGRKGHGKDSLARPFVDDFGFALVRFADPLKNMMRSLLTDAGMGGKLIEDCIEGPLKEEPLHVLCGKSPRAAMQTLGTEWRDMIGRELWAGITASRIDELEAKGFPGVVLPDVRFEHEAAFLRRKRAKLIRITRPDMEDGEHSKHISETEMDKLNVDFVVLNNGTLADLADHAKAIASRADWRG